MIRAVMLAALSVAAVTATCSAQSRGAASAGDCR
jgi:hypothetical protein